MRTRRSGYTLIPESFRSGPACMRRQERLARLGGCVLFYGFFFQAEDGIRDDLVTGVQTCALPIYRFSKDHMRTLEMLHEIFSRGFTASVAAYLRTVAEIKVVSVNQLPFREYTMSLRSEERRVGKECRSRWSPYH